MMYHYNIGKRLQLIRERERWFVLKIPRSNRNEVGEYEVT